MTLTFYDFNGLDDKGKEDAVFLDGTFVDDREEKGMKVQLYRLDGFYVEVFYDQARNEIIRYSSFSPPGRLGLYIK